MPVNSERIRPGACSAAQTLMEQVLELGVLVATHLKATRRMYGISHYEPDLRRFQGLRLDRGETVRQMYVGMVKQIR